MTTNIQKITNILRQLIDEVSVLIDDYKVTCNELFVSQGQVGELKRQVQILSERNDQLSRILSAYCPTPILPQTFVNNSYKRPFRTVNNTNNGVSQELYNFATDLHGPLLQWTNPPPLNYAELHPPAPGFSFDNLKTRFGNLANGFHMNIPNNKYQGTTNLGVAQEGLENYSSTTLKGNIDFGAESLQGDDACSSPCKIEATGGGDMG